MSDEVLWGIRVTYHLRVTYVTRVTHSLEDTSMTNETRIAVAMQKGGVGKSTTTINLAGALADAGHDVLLVDADPQGFATITLGFRDEYVSDSLSLYRVMTDVDRFEEVNDLLVPHDRFDVLPAHGENFQLERELWSVSRTQERLGMVLDEIETAYDYVLIDAPPNMGPLAEGSLLGAKNVLFVSKADSIATFSMNLLLKQKEKLEKEYQTSIGIVGAVVNAVSQNKISEQRLDWFLEHIGESNTFIVPETVAIEGAFNQESTVFNFEPTNRHRAEKADEVRSIYEDLARNVEEYNA